MLRPFPSRRSETSHRLQCPPAFREVGERVRQAGTHPLSASSHHGLLSQVVPQLIPITFWIAAQIAKDYRVVYVNADVSASDAKHYHAIAEKTGIELLLPDMKAGLSMQHVVKHLEAMNATGGNYERVVMIFDTLKKMTS